MTKAEYLDSFQLDHVPAELNDPYLNSLWYDRKGDWNNAHRLADSLDDFRGKRIHAYLHRKEGDIWNADYWYRKADMSRPEISLDEEWKQIVDSIFNE